MKKPWFLTPKPKAISVQRGFVGGPRPSDVQKRVESESGPPNAGSSVKDKPPARVLFEQASNSTGALIAEAKADGVAQQVKRLVLDDVRLLALCCDDVHELLGRIERLQNTRFDTTRLNLSRPTARPA